MKSEEERGWKSLNNYDGVLLRNKIRTKEEEEEMYIHNRKTRCGKSKESQGKTEREGAECFSEKEGGLILSWP